MLAARSSRALRATALPCKTACRAFSATVTRPTASVAAQQKQKQKQAGGDHQRVSKRSASAISINHLQVNQSPFASLDEYTPRHVGPREHEVQDMLSTLGFSSMEDFVDKVVPADIRIGKNSVSDEALAPLSENELVRRAAEVAGQNVKAKNFIGMGYHEAVVPPVIMRNILENPGWYTSYTPYQPEISQGRLESLINFQTVATSLTGLAISNASLLDEGTAAAEAMTMSWNQTRQKRSTFLVDSSVLPQTLSVLRTRAGPLGIKLAVGNVQAMLADDSNKDVTADLCGVLVQYPATRGDIRDWSSVASKTHELGGLLVCATDLLALTALKPPGEWGADIAVGNSARFGVPLGYGGPHAAFFSCSDALKRKLPGRLVGLSKDVDDRPAYRLALQTREQHIRREKATSNVCTAQALLANMASNYAVYHGPDGLKRIAARVHSMTCVVRAALERIGFESVNETFFDTLTIGLQGIASGFVHAEAEKQGINMRWVLDDQTKVGITLDESVTLQDIVKLLNVFVNASAKTRRASIRPYTDATVLRLAEGLGFEAAKHDFDQIPTFAGAIPEDAIRTSPFMTQPVFSSHKSETEMMRYLRDLQAKDLSLIHAMIPLGSCTMKLNAASSMTPLSWPEFANIHPFAPVDQAKGYQTIIEELCRDLAIITGLPAVSLQPNSGAQGEYAGLSIIRAYQKANGQGHRNVCLIPQSSHGTNPASAHMAGMKVVSIKTLGDGSLDLQDLRQKAEKHKEDLGAFMVTYPSTYGVFESGIREAINIIHEHGGQVYLDGANMNAQVGLTNPGACGADVCHLNLHKTFAIPHGGGGPGVGPICAASHLGPYMPGHALIPTGGSQATSAVTSSPFGSASILTISWAYCRMLGGSGLRYSSELAILNANYMAFRLKDHFDVKFKNENGLCAHEFLLDLAAFDKQAGIGVMDVAKRLQDYSFHPPTCAWPIQTAMLIEPTESESLQELDRFCDAMISIRGEIDEIIAGKQPKDNNVLKNAPHPLETIAASEWDRPYSREQAAYPVPGLRKKKFWPSVGRLQESFGDLNLVCECPSVDELAES